MYPWRGKLFDLGDLGVSDDVMEDKDLRVDVQEFLLERSNVEDGHVSSVTTHQLGTIRRTQLNNTASWWILSLVGIASTTARCGLYCYSAEILT